MSQLPLREPLLSIELRMDELQNNAEAGLTHNDALPHNPEPAPLPPNFAAVVQPSYAQTLFFGAEGLRPGWGFAFYVLMFYLLRRATTVWGGLLEQHWQLGSLRSMALEEFLALLTAFVPALVLSRVERRSWGSYGLPVRRAFGQKFWVGSVWGFGGITLLLALLHGAHVFDYGHIVLHGARMAKFAVCWAGMFLLVAFFEEFLFRGYAQFTLTRGIDFWPAAIVLSSAFGGIHLLNSGESLAGALGAASIGLFFCLTVLRTGNLWFAVGFHAAWDWGETFFYSVPDSGMVAPGHLLSSSFHGSSWLSGGSVGPEGSMLCLLVIAVIWIAFERMYPTVKQPVLD